ncbi:MAG: hypothetical protein FWD61_18525 [Phycisphaerales bacterium]|nr:hypothetical protein [Phycisphaerales bacterium]
MNLRPTLGKEALNQAIKSVTADILATAARAKRQNLDDLEHVDPVLMQQFLALIVRLNEIIGPVVQDYLKNNRDKLDEESLYLANLLESMRERQE